MAPCRAYDGGVDPVKAKVTGNGQISLPAELRHRWGVSEVVVVDHGDHAVVRPHPADPVRALRGKYADLGFDTGEMRRLGRIEEQEADDRRRRRRRR